MCDDRKVSTDAWSEQATEATVALIAEPAVTALGLISRIGAATSCGSMSFTEALALQGSFYDDGTDDRRAVFQIDQLSGRGGQWWATVEPNGFRLAFARNVRTVAAGQLVSRV
jgi:hypothetical protein